MEDGKRQTQDAKRAGSWRVFGVLSLAFCIFVSGCYERKVTGIINPDGSAKVLIETDIAVPGGMPGQPKVDALAAGREFAAQVIMSTQGVEAWSDVSVTAPKEGWARVTGTAYVGDIARLQFVNVPLAASWRKQEDGTYVFTVARPIPPAPPAAASRAATQSGTAPATAPSEAEVKEMVKQAQEEYQQTRGAMQTGLSALTIRLTYVLPGTVKSSRILEVTQGHMVSLVLDGKKLAGVLEKFMGDDAALAASLKAGRESTVSDDYLLEALYGMKGPVMATVTDVGAQAVFDYKTEVGVAKVGQDEMLKAAGIEMPRLEIRRVAPATQK